MFDFNIVRMRGTALETEESIHLERMRSALFSKTSIPWNHYTTVITNMVPPFKKKTTFKRVTWKIKTQITKNSGKFECTIVFKQYLNSQYWNLRISVFLICVWNVGSIEFVWYWLGQWNVNNRNTKLIKNIYVKHT